MTASEQPTAAVTPASTSLGQVLRDARVAKDLTIDQLATELRIEARQLAALEDNRFEQIGVPVFVKGYIRQYAQRLGLDQGRLIELYARQATVEEVEIKPSKTIKLRNERQITLWVVAALVLLLIAVGLAVWWLNGAGFEIAAAQRGAPGSVMRVEPASVPRATEPPPVEVVPASAETPAAPTSDAASPPLAETKPEPAAAPPSPAAAGDGPAHGAAIPLDLTFEAESWAEITDAQGQRLLFELATPGRHIVLRGEPPLAVTFGNGEAVRLLVDGKPYPIPPHGRLDKLVRFSIARDKD